MPLQGSDRSGKLRVRFVTPTELKGDGDVRPDPDFPTLTQRLEERVWALGRRYQGSPAEWDYRALLDLGRTVRLLDWRWDFKTPAVTAATPVRPTPSADSPAGQSMKDQSEHFCHYWKSAVGPASDGKRSGAKAKSESKKRFSTKSEPTEK